MVMRSGAFLSASAAKGGTSETCSRFDLADLRDFDDVHQSFHPTHRHRCGSERFVARCNRHLIDPSRRRQCHRVGGCPHRERSSGRRFDAKEILSTPWYSDLPLNFEPLPIRVRPRGAVFCWRICRTVTCRITQSGQPSGLPHWEATVPSPSPSTPWHCVQTSFCRGRSSD